MAEFQTVVNELHRICGIYDCHVCPIRIESDKNCNVWIKEHPEKAERIIMQWAAEHPRQTNGMKFKEVFGQPYECLFEASFFALEWLHAEYKGGQDEIRKGDVR